MHQYALLYQTEIFTISFGHSLVCYCEKSKFNFRSGHGNNNPYFGNLEKNLDFLDTILANGNLKSQ